jgi:hypothetical protein
VAKLIIQLTEGQTLHVYEGMTESGAVAQATFAPGCRALVIGDNGNLIASDGSDTGLPDPTEFLGADLEEGHGKPFKLVFHKGKV